MATTFGLDTSGYVDERGRTATEAADAIDPSLDSIEVLDEAEAAILSQLAGEIPDDVVAELERQAAEQSLGAGFQGEAATNLVARDLGLTSLDIQQQGIANALSFGELETSRQQFEQETELALAEFYQTVQVAEDNFALAVANSDQSAIELELQGYELLLSTESTIQELINQLVITNAQFEIEGLQEHLDELTGGFDTVSGDVVSLLTEI